MMVKRSHELVLYTRSFLAKSRVRLNYLPIRYYASEPVYYQEREKQPVSSSDKILYRKKGTFLKSIPFLIVATAGSLYYYWRYHAIVNDRDYLLEYIRSHHSQIIENAVRTGLASVNHPENINKTLQAFSNSEKYDPDKCKIQMAIMELRPCDPKEKRIDPKQFFNTYSMIKYSLLPEIVRMSEGETLNESISKLKVDQPYTVLQSRQCIINVDFPITVMDPSETQDNDKEYPVIAMRVEIQNLNTRLDRFIPHFFITKIALCDAEQTFPDSPHFKSNLKRLPVPQITIEKSLSVDGYSQVGDGVMQVQFNDTL